MAEEEEALQAEGYRTAYVGKWHLGLGSEKPTDWSGPIDAGPHTVCFEESVGIPSSLDIPPYCWFRDGAGDPPPSTAIEGSAHRRRDGGGFWRSGPIAEGFQHQAVLSRSIDESIRIIDRHATERPERPLFLELCLSAPHTPWLPDEAWRGSSGAGHYGDFVNQIDAEMGRLLHALDANGLGENTLVIFTSDNGSHWPLADVDRWGHASNLAWRGQKADIHEAGHRVPFLVRWPDAIEPGTVRTETICLTDLYATCLAAANPGVRTTSTDEGPGGEDSVDLLPLLETGDARGLEAREGIVHHSLDGMFAIRVGDWKLIEGLGSGGFTAPRRATPSNAGPTVQLYDLATDPGEITNLAKKNPAEVARLQAILDRVRTAPRSVR